MKEETKRKKEFARELKQLHILNTAEQIMLRDGLDGLSMSGVAKEAKIAKGTLYLYFKSKEDIIAHLTIKSRQELLKIFHQYAAKHEHPLQKIEAIMWANYYFHQKRKLYSNLVAFYEVNRHLEETEALRIASINISVFVKSLFQKAIKEKHVKADLDPTMMTMIMWGTTVGMIQFLENKSDVIHSELGKAHKALFASFIENFINGIKA